MSDVKEDFFSHMLKESYNMRVEWFKELNKDAEKGGIVLVGDSLTNEFLIHEMMDAYGRIHNRGIGGDTTSGVLGRINESIIDLAPSRVFLLIGTNDLVQASFDFNKTIGNISQIVDKTLMDCRDAEFYIISLLPVNNSCDPKINKFSVAKRTNEVIDSLNIQLKNLAQDKCVNYLDLNYLLKDETGNLKLEYTREGLHISPVGYKVILNELKKYF